MRTTGGNYVAASAATCCSVLPLLLCHNCLLPPSLAARVRQTCNLGLTRALARARAQCHWDERRTWAQRLHAPPQPLGARADWPPLRWHL